MQVELPRSARSQPEQVRSRREAALSSRRKQLCIALGRECLHGQGHTCPAAPGYLRRNDKGRRQIRSAHRSEPQGMMTHDQLSVTNRGWLGGSPGCLRLVLKSRDQLVWGFNSASGTRSIVTEIL